MPPRSPMAIGQQFDRLTVISEAAPRVHAKRGYRIHCVNVRCKCGSVFSVEERCLRSGNTTSCGCKRAEFRASGLANLRHGLCYSSGAYKSWRAMIWRCSCARVKNYGAKGISVCKRWQVFENFLADMGERPEGLTLERIDSNKGYSPQNCRWATYAEQARNTKSNRFVIVDGKRLCCSDATRALGLYPGSLAERAKRKGTSLQVAADHFAAKRR